MSTGTLVHFFFLPRLELFFEELELAELVTLVFSSLPLDSGSGIGCRNSTIVGNSTVSGFDGSYFMFSDGFGDALCDSSSSSSSSEQ